MIILAKKSLTDNPLGKAVLESLRWGLMAFVAVVVKTLLNEIPQLELDPSFTILLTASLRFADAILHKSGVAQKGLVRF